MLDKQIDIMSLDTGDFYSNHEARLHRLNHCLRSERRQLVYGGILKKKNGKTKNICGLKETEEKLFAYGFSRSDLKLALKNKCTPFVQEYNREIENAEEINKLIEDYIRLKKLIDLKNKLISKSKTELLLLLKNKVDANIASNGKHHMRVLRDDYDVQRNLISVFDSSFTRTIEAQQNELCEDFAVVQVYYFSIIKDIIFHGFYYKGEKYIYFTSSAGQIRTKKAVFVKESVWQKNEKTIMCGLTLDEINARGGGNPTKYLAYMALANSATDLWQEFDIDKTIVIDDFETDVFGTYDFVDETDYSVSRKCGEVPIPHTDGCGMILPNAFGVKQKNKMVRLPWIKGLLGVFDYMKFIQEHNCSPVIKDIYGVEHDIVEEDIQVIFCKSQFKMHQNYDSWCQYKTYYKAYNCTAGYTNPEEDRIADATINYQMLQTLVGATDEEIQSIAAESIDRVKNISSSVENIKWAFGATIYNQNKTAFQKAIALYPDLLNDEYIKLYLKEIKNSLVKKYKSGKLRVSGKYTFLLPDFYAACQYWFMGVKEPDGLLCDGEVFCWLFRKHKELDCLRSPHLFMEHAVRNNTAWSGCKKRQDELRKWFCTDAIYTSSHDLLSKILQFDSQ